MNERRGKLNHKNKKRMSRENRRKHIIKAAMKRFMESGYHATTTVSIAKEAGISEVTLYRYFSSKKELFRAVIEPVLAESVKKIVDELEEKNLKATEKLRFILKDRIEFILKHREMIKLILMEKQINPEVIPFDYIERTHSLLKKAAQEAGIQIKDQETTLRMLMGSILSFIYFPETEDLEVEEYIDQLIMLLIE